ncbi:hypothetical protein B0T21DRAFT_450837 [Apiosordaria backusii]|uniref:Uncharacterized protein n=1 Tax=Apiosordaria backusii TaxID=314023 RepID=A0AA40BKL6_9PEZI|nr:hypothetical protein B0T21DRAFT_450837 [Apiosordaria backusii]
MDSRQSTQPDPSTSSRPLATAQPPRRQGPTAQFDMVPFFKSCGLHAQMPASSPSRLTYRIPERRYMLWRNKAGFYSDDDRSPTRPGYSSDPTGHSHTTWGAIIPPSYNRSGNRTTPWICPIRGYTKRCSRISKLGYHFRSTHDYLLLNDNQDGTLSVVGRQDRANPDSTTQSIVVSWNLVTRVAFPCTGRVDSSPNDLSPASQGTVPAVRYVEQLPSRPARSMLPCSRARPARL